MKMEKQKEKEMDILWDEIPHATSPHHHHHHHHHLPITHTDDRSAAAGDNPWHGQPVPYDMYVGAALPQHHGHAHGNWLMSQGASSSSGSSSMSSDDGLRRSTVPGSHQQMEELGFLDRLDSMHVGNGLGEAGIGRLGNGPADPNVLQSGYGNASAWTPFQEDYRVVRHSIPRSTMPFDDKRRFLELVYQRHYSNLFDSWLQARRSGAPVAYPTGFYLQQNWKDVLNGLNDLQLGSNDGLGQNSHHGGVYDGNPVTALYGASAAEAFPQQGGVDLNWNVGSLNSPRLPVMNGGAEAGMPANGCVPQSQPQIRNLRNVEAFGCEDSLIIQGKGLPSVGDNRSEFEREHKKLPRLDDWLHVMRGSPVVNADGVHSARRPCSQLSPLKCDYLLDFEWYIYNIAKDQHGCRILQRKFDEGKPHEVDMIVNAIINHVGELMVNPFGNYLMQKLLEVCTEEQRMKILIVLTKDPAELIRISLNTHGTRAVQKLIETLKTPPQIALVISALQPGFLDLIKDLNGNHVVQRCLQSLAPEDNKFIFDAAAEHCVDIATHRHGCCVLQRCIGHATGEHQAKLVAEISANGLFLAQDAFGNYVVQYILDLKSPSATATLASQFKGHYVNLSTQKFSSNVVEKCLKVFGEEYRAQIIVELLSVSRFDQLLQDPYANYVIQSALGNSKGSLHAALVEAIRPHAAILRTSPYCKRIFSRTLLRK